MHSGRRISLHSSRCHGPLPKAARDRGLLTMLVPGLIYFSVFCYGPMYGAMIAFKDYSMLTGIWGSPWAGFKHFANFFSSPSFWPLLRNTFLISFYKLAFGFPVAIALALMLNEVESKWLKGVVQTISAVPHFVSWVVIAGIMTAMLSPTDGLINELVKSAGRRPVFFLGSKQWFRPILVVSEIWKESGWSAIIYLAAMSGIDPALYEAARVDGASKYRQIINVTLPGIRSTIAVLFILKVGNILNAGFEQVFTLINPLVMSVGDIIDTWVYRNGLVYHQYSLATAVNLFKSVVGMVLIFSSNWLIRRSGERGIW